MERADDLLHRMAALELVGEDVVVGGAHARERVARRTAARIAAGLCVKCGRTEPLPERRLCAPCNDKRNAASRARDARFRATVKPRRDPEHAKQYERERSRQLHAERKAAGICTKCGRAPACPERTTCEPCAEQHRDRARHARAKAEGIPYGGRDPEARRRAGRKRSRRRAEARKASGLCTRCGNLPPEEGRSMCEPCREDRRQAKRDRHAERRAAGLCVQCATPAPGGKTYCDPCARTRSRRRNLGAKMRGATVFAANWMRSLLRCAISLVPISNGSWTHGHQAHPSNLSSRTRYGLLASTGPSAMCSRPSIHLNPPRPCHPISAEVRKSENTRFTENEAFRHAMADRRRTGRSHLPRPAQIQPLRERLEGHDRRGGRSGQRQHQPESRPGAGCLKKYRGCCT